MMHITIHYGDAVISVPAVDGTTLARATADDLRVLICLCASERAPHGNTMDELCAALGAAAGCSAVTAAAAIAFWRGTGVLELSDTASDSSAAQPPVAPKVMPAHSEPAEHPASPVAQRRASDRLPTYSHTDMADLLETRTEIKENIDECSRIWGNMLNIQEINTVLGLADYIGLDWDYILSLMARCVADMDRFGMRHSMRYVEKQALHFYDEGIHTLDALQEKFRALDELRSAEGKLRALFGMGKRKLTPTETKYFSTWLHDFKYDYEIIEMAYNIAVDAKGTPKKSYINSILANWNRDGLRTPAAIVEAQSQFRAERDQRRAENGSAKSTPPASRGSFDTENFFDAAVRRSLGDPNDP